MASFSNRATLSNTCKLWLKFSLCPFPSTVSTPLSLLTSGRNCGSRPVSSISSKAREGRSVTSILFTSSTMRSRERIWSRSAISLMA